MTTDRPLLGITLMLGFCIVAPIGDAIAKVLGAAVPVGQLLVIRFGVQAVLLIPLIYAFGLPWRMRGRVLYLTALRTLLHITGIGAMFTALQYLPLADAIAIAFVMPFLMLLLGRFVLNEEVGARRLIACAVGFVGTLLVIQPSFTQVGWPALLPLVVAFNFALFMLVTRQIAKQTDPIGMQTVSGVMATVFLIPVIWLTHDWGVFALSVVDLPSADWGLLFAIGVLGTIAHLLMTWSLRYAPSATLAPMQYLEIPVATIIGFVVFRDLPNGLAALGIAITIGAGLYIILRERAIAQTPQEEPTAQEPKLEPAE